MKRIWKLFAGAAFLSSVVSCASRSRSDVPARGDESFWKRVGTAGVIYVGEIHDNAAHHRFELELVRGLLKRKVDFAIGWEMFDETQQPALNAWASRAISLKALMKRTDFERRWGTYSLVYRQILQIGWNAHVLNIALNAPPELTEKIARAEPLTRAETAMLPTGFFVSEQAYRNFVSMMGSHPGMDQTDLPRFFEAQNIWDQTMASRILRFEARHPEVKLLVLTGRGHVSGGYGVPWYVRQKSDLRQIILLP